MKTISELKAELEVLANERDSKRSAMLAASESGNDELAKQYAGQYIARKVVCDAIVARINDLCSQDD